jgi:hypothetical protein
MSVIVITPDRYETVRKTMRHLRAQTVKDRLEIVLVVPTREEAEIDESELKEFCQYRILEVGGVTSIAGANAVGVRHAAAPIIALTEDHSFPAPDWAEALIKAHRQPYAAVGPVVRNANPNSIVSWADLLIGYGPWLDPAPAGTVDHLPGHNSSYKRAVLLEYGDELEAMLEAETVLHWDLRAKGYDLYLEPAAKTAHTNFGRLSSWMPVQFHCGRLFAADRARQWSRWRRLFFVGGSPLIPLVRLYRIVKELLRPGRRRGLLPRALPALMVGLSLDAVGQMMGCACGAGDSKQRLSEFEFHRERHLAGSAAEAHR